MQKMITISNKLVKNLISRIIAPFEWLCTFFFLYANNVKFKDFSSSGLPKIIVALGGVFIIDENFKINNKVTSNPIGRVHKSTIFVGKNGNLRIGKNVGISSSSIVCHQKIEIGNNVKIGGNSVIYDTDFHSLDFNKRKNPKLDVLNTITKPVLISDNVFIGAHSTILKGVTIGENSIIGACSVVSKNIPSNEIWAGNPIKFIKAINIE